jgi:transposase-like protein
MARAGRKSQVQLTLDDTSRAQLTALLKAQKTPLGLARRAGAVLLFAGGQRFVDVARQVGMAERHVRKWIYRFKERGINGLQDGKRTGRPPVFSP